VRLLRNEMWPHRDRPFSFAADGSLLNSKTLRADFRRSPRKDDEDIVLEVMDFVAGWSGPHPS
jgi:hypothetical protein